MKLFITGGAGFIGSNFIHYWVARYPQDELIVIDKLTYAGNIKNIEQFITNGKIMFIQEDINNYEAMVKAMTGAQVVVHFAAESHVDRSILNPMEFVKTNVEGTVTLLNAARACKVERFHHISTDEVFGTLALNSEEKFNEQTPYNPHSPYSASKASSDHFVRAYYDTYGLPITISNCGNNYGPYHYPEKLFPLAITNILEGKKVPVYGDGLYVRDWLYVEDHCEAIDLILKKGKVGESYCIGGLSQDISNLDAIKYILKLMGAGEESIEYVADRPGHDRRYALDWSKINRELGWAPRHTFEEGIEKTITWFKTHEDWWKPLKEGAYKEYYEKQYGKKE